MAWRNELGKLGEEWAVQFFLQRGFTIRERNWRFRHYEIDLITEKKGMLHFVEVKLRHPSAYGRPEEQVSQKQFRRIQAAAAVYLERHPGCRFISFDILGITPGREGAVYRWIRDVFI
jgi:putative endonuclease